MSRSSGMSVPKVTGISTVTPASVMSASALVCHDNRHCQVRLGTVAPVDDLA